MNSARRLGALIIENEELQAQLLRLREQLSRGGGASADASTQLQIAELEARAQRNTLESLECQLELQQARISRFDGADPADAAISDAVRVLTTGLNTLRKRRDTAARQLRAAESALERLRATQLTQRPSTATTHDHD